MGIPVGWWESREIGNAGPPPLSSGHLDAWAPGCQPVFSPNINRIGAPARHATLAVHAKCLPTSA